MDRMIPNTAIAEIAATESAILLFLSFFFSMFNLVKRSVNFTLLLSISLVGLL